LGAIIAAASDLIKVTNELGRGLALVIAAILTATAAPMTVTNWAAGVTYDLPHKDVRAPTTNAPST